MPQVLPNSRIESRAIDAPALLRLWHLASLDAPTVALTWSLAFAWASHVHLPLWVLILLPLTVWSVYIADRLLDAHTALRTAEISRLRQRHLFHWRHRRILLPIAVAAAFAATCIVFTLMPPLARERNSILAAASLVYFTRVHAERTLAPILPKFLSKEFLVGLLFTAGCALPALTRLAPSTHLAPLLIPTFTFALLAWLNCHAIDRWETEPRIKIGLDVKRMSRELTSTDRETNGVGRDLKGTGFEERRIEGELKGAGFSPYIEPQNRIGALQAAEKLILTTIFRSFVTRARLQPGRKCLKIEDWALAPAEFSFVPRTSQWPFPAACKAPEGNLPKLIAPSRVFPPALLLALTALLAAALPSTTPRLAALLLTAAASAIFLALLDRLRTHLTPISLRTAADLVLLTPALLLAIR